MLAINVAVCIHSTALPVIVLLEIQMFETRLCVEDLVENSAWRNNTMRQSKFCNKETNDYNKMGMNDILST